MSKQATNEFYLQSPETLANTLLPLTRPASVCYYMARDMVIAAAYCALIDKP